LTPSSISSEPIDSPCHSNARPQRYNVSPGTQFISDYRSQSEPNTCSETYKTPLGCALIPKSSRDPYVKDHQGLETIEMFPKAEEPGIKRSSSVETGNHHSFRSSKPGATRPHHLPPQLLRLAIEQPHDVTQANCTLPKPRWTSIKNPSLP
jgi:hypothetical protein